MNFWLQISFSHSMSFLQELARPNILQLKPYRCARDDYSSGILLDANENAHGPCISGILVVRWVIIQALPEKLVI
jgi:hypothetical protein